MILKSSSLLLAVSVCHFFLIDNDVLICLSCTVCTIITVAALRVSVIHNNLSE